MSFSIKRALGSRKGWKIMPDDGQLMDGEALRRVVNMIKDIEYQVSAENLYFCLTNHFYLETRLVLQNNNATIQSIKA